MKLRVIFSLLIALTLITPHAAAANPKSGASCKAAGLTQVFQGKKFTCLQSGKKLLWNKGVPVKKQGPSTTNTAQGSIQERAIQKMKQEMKPQKVGNLFRYHYSPHAVQSFKDLLESDLDYAMSFWASVYKNPDLFNVFYGTEKDLDWLIQAWKPYGFDKNVGFANDFRGRIEREGQYLNAGAVPSQSDASHLSILRHSSLPTRPDSFVSHENVHIVQQYLTNYRTGQMPCWLREGSANLFGNFTMAEKFGADIYSQAKRSDMNNYLRGTSGVEIRKFSESEWLTHLKSLEGNFQGGCDYIYRFSYGSGLLLSEQLMAEHGFSKMMDFWRAFGLDKDWRTSFQEIYGIAIDDWYKTKAIPYLMSEYSRVKP